MPFRHHMTILCGVALDEIEERCIRDVEFRFVFAVHTYFSIQFNKLSVADQLKRLAEKESSPEPSVYAVPYRSLFYHVTGRQWDESAIEDAHQLKEKFDKLPSNIQNLRTEPGTLIAELMHFLPIDKEFSPYVGIIDESSKSLFEMQTRLIYIICNWDVQDQIMKHLRDDREIPKDLNVAELLKIFNRLKTNIITFGKRAVYPKVLTRESVGTIETDNSIPYIPYDKQSQAHLMLNIEQITKDYESHEDSEPTEREEEGV